MALIAKSKTEYTIRANIGKGPFINNVRTNGGRGVTQVRTNENREDGGVLTLRTFTNPYSLNV